jgi:DNA mismatch repair ATPase MutS
MGDKFGEFSLLPPEEQKSKFLQSATELFVYADMLTRSSHTTTAALSSEVERLKKELAESNDSLRQKEGEIDSVKAELEQSRSEAVSAQRRWVEDKRVLSSSMEVANSDLLKLQEEFLHTAQTLEETERLVKEADERADAEIAEANKTLKRIKIAHYVQGYSDGKEGVDPMFTV